MKKKFILFFVIALVIFGLDQWTKGLVDAQMIQGDVIPVWENFFDLVHVRNRGAAFGILSGWDSQYRDLFFYCLSAVALVFLFNFLREIPNQRWLRAIPVALICGGALGNIYDRWHRGSVVDFLSFHWYDEQVSFYAFGYLVDFDLVWPAFNVADSAITCGVSWLVVQMLFTEE